MGGTGGRCAGLTTLRLSLSRNSGNLNILQAKSLSRAAKGLFYLLNRDLFCNVSRTKEVLRNRKRLKIYQKTYDCLFINDVLKTTKIILE